MTAQAMSVLLPLEVESLGFAAGGATLIDRVGLRIEHPGISVIMGPNGAGKSLLLRLLHGLLEPTSGRIRWGGRPLDAQIRRRQAMVFQKPVLMRRSVAANVDFVLGRGQRERRDALLREAGLYRQRRQPARLLSGGEQQRLALARALATDPEVLLLDEPCASLDSGTTLAIENRLQAARADGLKIVLVTHDLGQARRLGDEILFMHRGRIVEHQSASAFFAAPLCTEARAYVAGKIVI